MLHASGTVKSRNNVGHLGGFVCCIRIYFGRVSIKIVVGSSTLQGFIGCGHLFVAGISLVAIKGVTALLMGYQSEVRRFLGVHIAVCLYHATVLARKGTFAIAGNVASLFGDEHGLVHIAEIVALHKHVASHGGSHAIFGYSVEVVVIDVHRHCTHAWMTAIAMVEPVVVIGDEVLATLAGHATQGHFSTIPKSVVREGHKLRIALAIERAVPLGLVTVAACLSVEEVHMMHPTMAVVGVDGDAVVHAQHDTQIADLHTFAIAYQHAESTQGGIISNAFQCNIHLGIGTLSFDLQSFSAAGELVHVGSFDGADDADGKWSLVVPLLTGIKDGLKTGERLCGSVAFDCYVTRYCFCRGSSYVEHLGAGFQCAVIGVSTYARVVEVGKSCPVMCTYGKNGRHGGFTLYHISIGIHSCHLKLVVAGFQSQSIGSSINAVVAHQRGIQLCIFPIHRANTDTIGGCSLNRGESDIGGFKPAARFVDCQGKELCRHQTEYPAQELENVFSHNGIKFN